MTALRTKVINALTSNKISEKDIVTNEQLPTSVVVPPNQDAQGKQNMAIQSTALPTNLQIASQNLQISIK
jgi:hypothetical protein